MSTATATDQQQARQDYLRVLQAWEELTGLLNGQGYASHVALAVARLDGVLSGVSLLTTVPSRDGDYARACRVLHGATLTFAAAASPLPVAQARPLQLFIDRTLNAVAGYEPLTSCA